MSNEQLKQVGAVSLVNDDNLKNELIAKIYDLVIKMVCQPDSKIIIREYQKYLIWKNQLVSILVNDNKIVGKITGISDDFQLRLVDEKKQEYLLTTEESQHLRIK